MPRTASPKGKTFLHKKAFLSDDKNDSSAVLIEVRTYDYGGSTAEFRITNGDRYAVKEGGFIMFASLADKKNVADVNKQVDALIGFLTEYKKAINAAAKEAQKNVVEVG